MAEQYKILGQIAPTDSKEHILYKTNSGISSIVTNITLTNRSASEKTFDINFYDSAVAEADLADVSGSTTGFVGLIGGNTALVSDDGITWSINQISSGQVNISRIAYGNGTYVAVDFYFTSIFYSTNGTVWTETFNKPPSMSGEPSTIAYGNGKFVFITNSFATGTSIPYYSTDGITWSQGIAGQQNSGLPVIEYDPAWINLAYGNNVFVAIRGGYNGSAYAWSSDGINWNDSGQNTILPQGGSANWDDFIFGNNEFVAIAGNDNAIYSSVNGITWSSGSMPQVEGKVSIAYGAGKYVIHTGMVAYVAFGINQMWSPIYMSESTMITSNTNRLSGYDGTKFVVTGQYSQNVIYSTDGMTWSSASLGYLGSGEISNLIERTGTSLVPYSSPLSKSLFKSFTVPAYSFEVLEPGILMEQNNTVLVKSSSDTTISIYGTEIY